MKRQSIPHKISVTLTQGIQLEERELSFLRKMAQHCSSTHMSGSTACERLDEMLRALGVGNYDESPPYDIFKETR